MNTAEVIVAELLEGSGRFFVQLEPEHRKAADEYSVGSYKHNVLDRETVVDGRYKVMADNLDYLTAYRLAQQMNASPEQAEQLAASCERPEAPRHNLGWPGAPKHYRTF